MEEQFRQDRKRHFIENFEKGNLQNNNCTFLDLYPSELDRFKKEFPKLTFEVKGSHMYFQCKQYKVCIKKQNNEQ